MKSGLHLVCDLVLVFGVILAALWSYRWRMDRDFRPRVVRCGIGEQWFSVIVTTNPFFEEVVWKTNVVYGKGIVIESELRRSRLW